MNVLKAEISVLMSVYNEKQDEISKAVQSVLNQTAGNLELIIVNDNPGKKEYAGYLEDWRSRDNRIIIIENEQNIGLAASMNKALECASGEYIARMDADDISVSDRFEKELSILSTGKYDVVFTNYASIGDDDSFLDDGKPVCNIAEGQDITEQIVFNGAVHHPTVMMRKEALLRVNGYRIFPCSQDQDLWIRMLESGARFYYLDEVLLHYRIRQNSITQKRQLQQYATIQYILDLLIERINHSGEDSYSEEAYQQYIKSRCNDNRELKGFDTAVRCLINAKSLQENGKQYDRILQRLKAFSASKTIRKTYLFKLRNRKKVMEYISAKQSGIQ